MLSTLNELVENKNVDKFRVVYEENLNSLEYFEHQELLFRSCRLGLIDLVDIILNSKRIDVNDKHLSTNSTLLFITIRSQQKLITEYLIQIKNAEINHVNFYNETCLSLAISKYDLCTIKLLINYN
ncbi:unnamed protein product, partial [Didymodactylos carnosus]